MWSDSEVPSYREQSASKTDSNIYLPIYLCWTISLSLSLDRFSGSTSVLQSEKKILSILDALEIKNYKIQTEESISYIFDSMSIFLFEWNEETFEEAKVRNSFLAFQLLLLLMLSLNQVKTAFQRTHRYSKSCLQLRAKKNLTTHFLPKI